MSPVQQFTATSADEQWKHFMARQSVLQTQHLERIREYVGALLLIVGFILLVGLPVTIFF